MERIEVHGNVSGSIVAGDNNFVVNTNHGTIVYKQAAPRVKLRDSAPLPPRPPRNFVGRANELARLENIVKANEAAVIHAPDGMGKSALIKQAANGDAARALPHGVVIVEAVDERGEALGPDDVIQRLFDALFESDPPLKVNATTARTYLSSTRPLVLLDGLSLPPALLNALPDLFPKGALLITAARAPSGDATERVKLDSLPRAEAMTLLMTRTDVTVSEANRGLLDSICALLSDVPLALVTAANAIRENSIPLGRAREIMEAANPSSGDSTRAAIERAYALAQSALSNEERTALAAAAASPAMSVDPRWIGGEAAIARLTGMGLLHANSPRLRIAPGLHAFARRSADDNAAKEKLLAHLLGGALFDKFRDWSYCADELGGVLGLIEWAAAENRHKDVIALGRAIDPYLTLHGLWGAWQATLERILPAARQSGDRATEAWALHQLGAREIGAGTRDQAVDFLRRALDLRRALGDTEGMAYTQHNLDLLIPPAPPRGGEPKPKPPQPGGGLLPILLLGLGVVGVAAVLLAAIGGFVLITWLNRTPTPVSASPMPVTAAAPPAPTPAEPAPISTATPTRMPTRAPTVNPCTFDDAKYVADVTIPDGTTLAPSTAFTKTWRVMNTGTCAWDSTYSLVFVGGNQMSGPAKFALPGNAAPGATMDISVNLIAPDAPGTYAGEWRLANPSHTVFGTNDSPLTVSIVVPATPTPTPFALIVNSQLDEPDANPGDKRCFSEPSGHCTLRAAIMEANALPDADTIILPPGEYVLTVVGSGEDAAFTGDLDITDDLSIVGSDAEKTIVNAIGLDGTDRVFHIVNPATVTISGVTIQDGEAEDVGGGILNTSGTLTLTDVIISNNAVTGAGGGIANGGRLTLIRSEISGNRAVEGRVKGQSGAGGGIYNIGTLTLGDSTIHRNTATIGGGIYNDKGGTAALTASLISDNSAGVDGGGIYNVGSLTLINSTLSKDSVKTGFGGGLHNTGTTEITNVTFSGNYAPLNGGEGIYNDEGGTAVLWNTIVADSANGGNCAGVITSKGHNLDDGKSCYFDAPGDLSFVSPLLGPLADNGGPTLTQALSSKSAAINSGDNFVCPKTDQRGKDRNDGACDIGAYEYP